MRFIFDEDLLKEEEKNDGYYAVTTNLEDNEMDIIAINHNRFVTTYKNNQSKSR